MVRQTTTSTKYWHICPLSPCLVKLNITQIRTKYLIICGLAIDSPQKLYISIDKK